MWPVFLCVCFCAASHVAAEVAGYADVAKQIIDLAVYGAARNRSYGRLADFTDTIGNRVSGSHNLEMAIKYMSNAMTQDGLDVHLGECGCSFLVRPLLNVSGKFILCPLVWFPLQSLLKSHTGWEGRRVQRWLCRGPRVWLCWALAAVWGHHLKVNHWIQSS